MRKSLVVFPLLLLGGCANPDASQPVRYADTSDGPMLGQAIFPPDNLREDGAAVAVLIHGGAWVRGHREDMGAIGRRLASQGIVCFSIDYRLGPTNAWPAPLEDARTAVKWVKEHARELRVDPRRVVAVGSSAGAQIALSLSARGECPAGSLYGPSVMTVARLPTLKTEVEATTWRDPARERSASPLFHVGPGSLPAFLIQGDKDVTVPVSHALEFAAAMRKAGRPVETRILKDRGHEFDGRTFDAWAAIDAMGEWILKQRS